MDTSLIQAIAMTVILCPITEFRLRREPACTREIKDLLNTLHISDVFHEFPAMLENL